MSYKHRQIEVKSHVNCIESVLNSINILLQSRPTVSVPLCVRCDADLAGCGGGGGAVLFV